jgi:hypothetical protein
MELKYSGKSHCFLYKLTSVKCLFVVIAILQLLREAEGYSLIGKEAEDGYKVHQIHIAQG